MFEFFGTALNQIIDNYSDSKNTLIQRTGIDRSTFFQILKGKRIPTSEQLEAILNTLLLPATDEMRLRDAFLHDRLGDEGYRSRKTVLGLLTVLREDDERSIYTLQATDSSKPAVFPYEDTTILSNAASLRRFIYSALKKTQNDNTEQIDLFLPMYALRELDFYQTESILAMNSGQNMRHFRHSMSISFRSDPFTEEMLLDYQEYIRFLISYPQDFQSYYYYDSSNMKDSLGNIFPYYIIFPFGVLMINAACTEGLFTREPIIISEYQRHFEQRLTRMKPMITNTQSLEEYIPFLLSLPDETKNWYLTYQPGISYLANDQMIERYIPEEARQLYKTHIKAFQHTDYHEFISPEGMKDMFFSGKIRELHVEIAAKDGDLDYVRQLLSSRLGKTLDLINPEHLVMPHNWAIHVISGHLVSFVPLFHGNRAIFIHERKLADCFETFFSNLNEGGLILPADDAREMMAQVTNR